jgi:formiminoglutamase
MKKALKIFYFWITWKLYLKSVLDLKKTDDRVRYNTYDSIGIRKEKSLAKRWQVPLNL